MNSESHVDPESTAWQRMPSGRRRSLIWTLWFTTWVLLIGGLWNSDLYVAVVAFSAVHFTFVWFMNGFHIAPFAVQVRFAYVVWVALGTYVPALYLLLPITMVGLVGNLFFRYCPLARLMYLLPWNRSHGLSARTLVRVFVSPGVDGRFRLDS